MEIKFKTANRPNRGEQKGTLFDLSTGIIERLRGSQLFSWFQ